MKKLFLVTLCASLISCGNDDDTVDCSLVLPPPSNMIIKLVDGDGNSLIGTTFVQDSFKLSNPTSTTYIRPYTSGAQDELVIWYDNIDSDATYFLELSSEDSDTLVVGHSTVVGDCFSFKTLDSFLYNNETLFDGSSNSDFFIITKE